MLRDKIRNSRWLWAALVIGLASVSIATAVSAHGSDTSLIHACVNAKTGMLRIVGPTIGHIPGNHEICRQGEVNLEWSIMGPQGPKGDIGPQGPPGDSILTGQSCPPGQFVTGVDSSGQLVCAGPTTPVPTDTPVPTATTPPPTDTPTATATTDPCTLINVSWGGVTSSQKAVSISISSTGVTLTGILIAWPIDTNGTLDKIKHGGFIANTTASNSPAMFLVSESIGTSDSLEFWFANKDVASTGYSIILTFAEGCTKQVTN
jgi:hypothetical protein